MNKSPEPIILAVVLLLLAITAAGLAYEFPSLADITGVTSMEPQGHPTKPLNAQDIESSVTVWNSPVLWKDPSNHHRLFQSAEYLFYASAYPSGQYIAKLDPNTRSPSGVLLSWYRQYSLDFTDSNVDREDPDGDGFSNIVEFKNDPVGVVQKAADCDGSKSTNPLDPQAHPPYLARLRLQQYETRPFHIQFKGYDQINGTYVFQIHLNDVPSSSQPALKKTGDPLGLEGYVIGPFHQIFKMEKDPATGLTVNTDESTLELDKPEIDLHVIVPFRKEIDSPEYTASFVMLLPTETEKIIKIARGKIFTVPFMQGSSFMLREANAEGATIRDTKTNADSHIPKLDPKEWNEVPAPAAAASNKSP
jgi:hypothetical protein